MKSFDFFGTLCAGCNPAIRDGEQDRHVPIAENIAKVQNGDIVISDYHTPEKAQRILREVCGLPNDLLVSHDDKATGKVWDRLATCGQMPSEHFGDDPHTDYSSPKSRGIPSTLTTIAKRTLWEEQIAELGLVALADIVREARLRTWNADPELRAMQLFQIEANFPFLYVASLWFHKKLIEGGYTKFLMSSRDCFLWKKIMDRIIKAEWYASRDPFGPSYEVVYWYTSRYARYKPSLYYLVYCSKLAGRKTLITDFCGFGHSLLQFQFNYEQAFRVVDGYLGDICLLVGYPSSVMTMDNTCVLPCAIQGWVDESSNLARHAMVLGMDGESPVFWQDGIDWTANVHINTMHDAFDTCVAAMDNYPFPQMDNLDDLLRTMYANMGTRLKALDPVTPFRRDEAYRAAELLKGIEGVIV